MDDKELLEQCYHRMYQGMIQKDMSLLDKVLERSFLLVHMTGMRQAKKQYMDDIANGTLNYYSEKTEFMDITVENKRAWLIGRSKVNAAVFGGGRNLWRLQLTMKAIKENEMWYFTEAVAATY